MNREIDLIDQAIIDGKLTIFPIGKSTAEHECAKKKPKKKRRGERVRPCAHCETLVRFVKGAWKTNNKRHVGWHWENQDGTHHRCGDFRRTSTWSPSSASQ